MALYREADNFGRGRQGRGEQREMTQQIMTERADNVASLNNVGRPRESIRCCILCRRKPLERLHDEKQSRACKNSFYKKTKKNI